MQVGTVADFVGAFGTVLAGGAALYAAVLGINEVMRSREPLRQYVERFYPTLLDRATARSPRASIAAN